MKYFILTLVILTSFLTTAVSQEVRNIRVTQNGNRVNVLFDLDETSKTYKVDLFVTTDDGKTWTGPLKSVSGDVGNNVAFGNNRQIIWDIISEKGLAEGYMQFKVVAEALNTAKPPKVKSSKTYDANAQLKKYKKGKTIFLTTAIAATGTGIFAYLQGNKLYDKYKIATDDAADIHKKIETYDIMAPVAFAIAGVSTVSFIIYSSKYGKANKQLSFQPYPLQDGGGLTVSLRF